MLTAHEPNSSANLTSASIGALLLLVVVFISKCRAAGSDFTLCIKYGICAALL